MEFGHQQSSVRQSKLLDVSNEGISYSGCLGVTFSKSLQAIVEEMLRAIPSAGNGTQNVFEMHIYVNGSALAIELSILRWDHLLISNVSIKGIAQ